MKALTTQQKIALAMKYPHVARVIEQHRTNEVLEQMKKYKGDKGDIGKAGIDGKNGLNGRDGANGINGKDGRNGNDGLDGQDGKDGQNGVDAVVDYDKIVKELRQMLKDGKDGKDAIVDSEMIEMVLKPHLLKIYDHVGRSIQGMPRGSNYGGFIETSIKAGPNITVSKDGSGSWVITSTGSGEGSGFQLPLSGALGQNTFTWATPPNVIAADGAVYIKVQQDGGIVWTGTTTTVLEFSPNSSIFALA